MLSNRLKISLLGPELLQVPAFLVSPAGDILAANAQAESLFGRRATQLVGVAMTAVLPASCRDPYRNALELCLSSPAGASSSERISCTLDFPGRNETAMEIVLAAVCDEGESMALNVILEEGAQAEEEQRETYLRMERVLSGCPVPYFLLGAGGTIEECNDAFLRLLGYEGGRPVGQSLSAFVGAGTGEAVCRQLLTLADGGGGSLRTRLNTRTGRSEPLEIHANLVRGSAEGLIACFIRDVVGQEILEEHLDALHLILDCFHAPAFLARSDGRLLAVNDAACLVLGFSREELLAMTLADIVAGAPAGGFESSWAASPSAGLRTLERLLRAKDGSRIPAIATERCMEYHGRHYLLAVASELTADPAGRRKMMAARRREALGRFAGGLAHTFNDLLTVIMGHGDCLLSRMPPGDPGRADVEAIQRASRRGSSLTARLLEFGREEERPPGGVDLNAVVRRTLDMITPLIGEDITLVSDIGPEAMAVRASPRSIEHIIMMLAANAREAMPEGGVLSVRTTYAARRGQPASGAGRNIEQGPFVRLIVSDTGCRMDSARAMEALLAPKEGGEFADSGQPIHLLVEECGGHLQIGSETGGKGTAFELYLPLVSEKEAADTGRSAR